MWFMPTDYMSVGILLFVCYKVFIVMLAVCCMIAREMLEIC